MPYGLSYSDATYNLHVPAKLLSIIMAVHDHSTAAIRTYRKTSDEFATTSGVHQECVLAPALFKLYFSIVIHVAIEKHHQEGRGHKKMKMKRSSH